VKALLAIFVILAVLTASLQGAAEVAYDADPAPLSAEDPAGETASESDEGEDDCVVCTPFCHCSLHGAALVAGVSRQHAPAAASFPARAEVRHVSQAEPPSLPPPIV
jgi:hypothetical protein